MLIGKSWILPFLPLVLLSTLLLEVAEAFPSCFSRRCEAAVRMARSNHEQQQDARLETATTTPMHVSSRFTFLHDSVSSFVTATVASITLSLLPPTLASYAFEGGVGGLGKTKPETGVTLREGFVPLQNPQGFVLGEVVSPNNERPILVQFQSPWPLLPTTSGLEARDLQQPESAFVQVVPNVRKKWTDVNTATKIITESVLGQQGKFGAYGSPTDIKVKLVTDTIVECKFTTYTPSMRESDRQVLIKQQEADNTLVLLVAGTTSLRFPAQRATLLKVVDSFEAIAAPQSSLKR